MKIISSNKKAYFDYQILKKFTAGIILTGPEVKSVREGKVNLKGSFVVPKGEELFVENMHISAYQKLNQEGYIETKKRKILLNEKEITEIITAFQTSGQTIVPLALGLEGRFIKLEIGICKGKKQYDKRESLKNKDLNREMKRNIFK